MNKDLLFEKYNDLDEIYDEVRSFLKKNGFEVDNEFLKKYVGEVNGTIYG